MAASHPFNHPSDHLVMSSSDEDSSSDDDDGKTTPVRLERYAALELHTGLSQWCTRIRATEELRACFQHLYTKHAAKPMQACMFKDALLAVQQCDSRAPCQQAVEQLVQAATAVLPQQKKSLIAAEHKQVKLRLHRAGRRAGDHNTAARQDSRHQEEQEADEEEEGAPSCMFDLPLPDEVLLQVFALLDPVALAACLMVCRSWRGLGQEPRLWVDLASQLYPAPLHSAQPRPRRLRRVPPEAPPPLLLPHAQFCRLAMSDPLPLLPFKTRRALAGGRPVWLQLQASAGGSGSGALGPRLLKALTVQQAMKKVRTSCSGSSPQGTDRQDDDGSTSSPRRSKRLAYKTPFWSPASAASTEVSQPHSINLLAGQCSQQPSSCGPPSLALTDDKPSVASTFQLSFSTAATGLASFRDTDRCGLWGVLPEEVRWCKLTYGCQGRNPFFALVLTDCRFHGQLGNDHFVSQKAPVVVSLGFKSCQDNSELEEETMPAVVACGAHHSTSISRKGELYSWGLGCNGELGLGRWSPIELALPRQCSSPHMRVVSVACGANHTLAIAETGTLWSCGRNRHGQLGTNTLVDGSRLQMVLHLGGYRIVSAAAGSAHSLALASDGSLFTWGDGSHGQLGHSQLQHIAAMMPANNPITMPSAQKISRLDPASLSPDNRVTAISAGAHHSIALTVGGAILSFGANSMGQLGTGDLQDRWKPTRVPLALPEEGQPCLRVVQLACGAAHSVALFSNQGSLEVRTAGCNAYGQLGHGDRSSRCLFTPVPRIPNVVAVQAGDEHSCAITTAGELFLWGRGDSGQLGMGDMRAKWKPTLLKDHQVVHPDKTLRRNKRNQPFTRSVARDGESGPSLIM
ncbi:hypothetical protein QJQ45_020596 [Haematococcus lacustris]|nr:hypothetical protein QJQ45_020596 [Haematococcus lacustris]